MNIKILAAVLLLEHVISGIFIGLVILKQRMLLRAPITNSLKKFRMRLLYLSIVIFIGNLIPILIDTLTIFADLRGRPAPHPIGIAYAVSNATTAIVSSILIWGVYRIAASRAKK